MVAGSTTAASHWPVTASSAIRRQSAVAMAKAYCPAGNSSAPLSSQAAAAAASHWQVTASAAIRGQSAGSGAAAPASHWPTDASSALCSQSAATAATHWPVTASSAIHGQSCGLVAASPVSHWPIDASSALCSQSTGVGVESAVVMLPERVKTVGTCHKCGATLLGPKPSARCTGCGANFHTADCGSRLAKSGVDLSCLSECPRCTSICQCSGGVAPCHAHAMKKRRREKQPVQATASATRASIPADADADDGATKQELREELRQVRAENTSLRAALRDALQYIASFVGGARDGACGIPRGLKVELDINAALEGEGDAREGPVALTEGAEGDLRSLLTRRALTDVLAVTYPFLTLSLVGVAFYTLNAKETEMRMKKSHPERDNRIVPARYAVGSGIMSLVSIWVLCLHVAARHAVGRRGSPPPARDYLAPVAFLIILTALWGLFELFASSCVLVKGTGEGWVRARYGTDDGPDIIKIALMESCLIGMQVVLMVAATRRTLHLRVKVVLYRRLCIAQSLAWGTPWAQDDGELTNVCEVEQDSNEPYDALSLPLPPV